MTCEFCGAADTETRLIWSDEHRRKVRCCRTLAPCLDRVLAPVLGVANKRSAASAGGLSTAANDRSVRSAEDGNAPSETRNNDG